MVTLREHLARSHAAIERDAAIYAASYGCSIDKARADVEDEYAQGWHEEDEANRHQL